MRFSLTSLVKLSVLMGILAFMVAIELVRLEPEAAHFRMKSPPLYGVINGFILNSKTSTVRFLNDSTGELHTLKLPEGQGLDFATCSPWVDDRGEHQIIGRWEQHVDEGREFRVEQFGIARYAMPSGRLIGKMNVEPVPAGHPCWYPGNASRVLFAAGDGALYQLDFKELDRNRDADGVEDELYASSHQPVPEPIRWRCAPPSDRMMVMDPVWKPDSRLGDRLIASLSFADGSESERLTRSHLWWLKLDPRGNEIVDAGPLDPSARTEDQDRDRGDERHASLGVTPSGEIVLAYLRQRNLDYGRWELHLAPIAFDPETDAPSFRPDASRILSKSHLSETPRFSSDGESLYGILRSGREGQGKIERFSSNLNSLDPRKTLASLPPG